MPFPKKIFEALAVKTEGVHCAYKGCVKILIGLLKTSGLFYCLLFLWPIFKSPFFGSKSNDNVYFIAIGCGRIKTLNPIVILNYRYIRFSEIKMPYKHLTDQELVTLLKQGDHGAFEEIFKRYNTILYAHAYNKLRDADDAHDVVQEVFSRLWIRKNQLEIENKLSGYIFTSVRNQIFDQLRHKKVISSFEDSFNKFDTKSYLITDHLVREKQFAALIEKEIASLPTRMREVFELRRKEHLSNKEIAIRMGITESTVADQMKKALKSLRLKLGLSLIIMAYLFL